MINALALAGAYLDQHSTGNMSNQPELAGLNQKFFDQFEEQISKEYISNPWFTTEFVRLSLGAIASMLNKEKLKSWLDKYPGLPVDASDQLTVGVVMAGNIPLVGFHDFLSILVSGHRFFGKPSSKDSTLVRLIAEILEEIDAGFKERITFTDEYLKDADAQIATGSNNSSRYFDYYFKDIPHIIRKNRNAIAVLSGDESRDTLVKLGNDIFTYFGLGCRNVTKIYIPDDYDLTILMESLEDFMELADHHKYANNIDYQRSVYLMNRIPFLDNHAVLMTENKQIASPVGVVFYEKYSELDSVRNEMDLLKDEIQCVVSSIQEFDGAVPPGQAQFPGLSDYADGVDTLKFLNDIAN